MNGMCDPNGGWMTPEHPPTDFGCDAPDDGTVPGGMDPGGGMQPDGMGPGPK
jgi:hypothetical protein